LCELIIGTKPDAPFASGYVSQLFQGLQDRRILVAAASKGYTVLLEILGPLYLKDELEGEWYHLREDALVAAARQGHLDSVESLVRIFKFQRTSIASALSAAAASGELAILQLFLQKFGRPDEPNSTGKTALHVAAAKGQLAVVNRLLGWKADPNVQDRARNTALDYASQSEYLGVVDRFLQAGARLETPGKTWVASTTPAQSPTLCGGSGSDGKDK